MIEEELKQVNNEISAIIGEILPDNSLRNFTLKNSKRIRSKLIILYLKALGIELNKNGHKLLAAGEIIHNASLLHDDIIDDAKIRRNESTIGEKFTPKISILCGDYLIAKAIDLLIEIDNNQILKILKNTVEKMSIAEIKQYFLRGNIPLKEEYIQICEDKTATLFESIAECTAILLKIDKRFKIKEFAKLFGIYFQINNDLEPTSALSDKKNKIYTACNIFGIENVKTLLDNYRQDMNILLESLPENIYKRELEDLFR